MIRLIECFPEFDVCSSKIGSIISTDYPDIPSLANESFQCQYEGVSGHAVCMLPVSICTDMLDIQVKHCTIIFSLFATILNQKWPKHLDITIEQSWLLGGSWFIAVWYLLSFMAMQNFFPVKHNCYYISHLLPSASTVYYLLFYDLFIYLFPLYLNSVKNT